MVTGRELNDFAVNNGLLVPPYVDLDEYAGKINENGGKCIARMDRMCPCQECLIEIEDADDDVAACAGRMFCDKRYATYWEKSWKKYSRQKEREERQLAREQAASPPVQDTTQYDIQEIKQSSPQATTDVDYDNYEAKNESIAGMLDALRGAKDALLNEEDGEATAFDILQQEMENHVDCDLCMGVLDAESTRALMLSKECQVDHKACDEDMNRAIERIDTLIHRFVDLDIDLVNNPIIPELDSPSPSTSRTATDNTESNNQMPAAKQRINGGERTFKDKFHECVSKTLPLLKEENPGTTPQERFREATRTCREEKKWIKNGRY
jgi:hypothetical protein